MTDNGDTPEVQALVEALRLSAAYAQLCQLKLADATTQIETREASRVANIGERVARAALTAWENRNG